MRAWLASLRRYETVLHEVGEGRAALVWCLEGSATLDGETLETGQCAAISEQSELRIAGAEGAQILVVDVPSDE